MSDPNELAPAAAGQFLVFALRRDRATRHGVEGRA